MSSPQTIFPLNCFENEKKPIIASVLNAQELNFLVQNKLPIVLFKSETVTPSNNNINNNNNLTEEEKLNNQHPTSIESLVHPTNKGFSVDETFLPLPNKQGEIVVTKQPNEINAIGNSRMTRCEISATMYDPEMEAPCLAQDIKIVPKTLEGVPLPNFLRSISITEGKIQCSFLPMEKLKICCSKLGISFPSLIKLAISHPQLKTGETQPFKLVCRLPPLAERSKLSVKTESKIHKKRFLAEVKLEKRASYKKEE